MRKELQLAQAKVHPLHDVQVVPGAEALYEATLPPRLLEVAYMPLEGTEVCVHERPMPRCRESQRGGRCHHGVDGECADQHPGVVILQECGQAIPFAQVASVCGRDNPAIDNASVTYGPPAEMPDDGFRGSDNRMSCDLCSPTEVHLLIEDEVVVIETS